MFERFVQDESLPVDLELSKLPKHLDSTVCGLPPMSPLSLIPCICLLPNSSFLVIKNLTTHQKNICGRRRRRQNSTTKRRRTRRARSCRGNSTLFDKFPPTLNSFKNDSTDAWIFTSLLECSDEDLNSTFKILPNLSPNSLHRKNFDLSQQRNRSPTLILMESVFDVYRSTRQECGL